MSFDAVLGQDRARKLVQSALGRDRLGHAYLFSGPEGVGKTLFAIELAKVLFCRSRGTRPCDQCHDCRMADNGAHPDLMLVEVLEGRTEILIEQARNAGRFLTFAPVQAERRVAILRGAEQMNEPTANSLLKTLEEPAAFGILILTTSRPGALLATIRSRCQEIRFAPLAPEQIQTILSAQADYEEREVRIASRFAGGSAGRALELLESGSLEFCGSLLGGVLALPEGDPFSLAVDTIRWVGNAPGKLEMQRERMRDLLRLLSYAYRDLLLLKVGGDAEALLFQERRDSLAGAAGRFTPRRLLRVMETLWEARRQTDANADLKLIIENLFARLKTLQKGD
jgi:DNA polymerase-3 subunit delta'